MITLMPLFLFCAHWPGNHLHCLWHQLVNTPGRVRPVSAAECASICLKILFSFLFSGSGKHKTEILPQHFPCLADAATLRVAWKGCVLPGGTQAACQLWDLPRYISDGAVQWWQAPSIAKLSTHEIRPRLWLYALLINPLVQFYLAGHSVTDTETWFDNVNTCRIECWAP